MLFKEIDESYYQEKLRKEEECFNAHEKRKRTWVSARLTFTTLIIGVLGLTAEPGTFFYVLGSIVLMFSWFLLVYTIRMLIIIIGFWKRLKKLKKESTVTPILEIQENGEILYQIDNTKKPIVIDTVIKIEDKIIKGNKCIKVTGKKDGEIKEIDISYGLQGIDKIQKTLTIFINMEKSRTYDYMLFKEMLQRYRNDPNKMMEEITNMDFLLAVNYYFDTAPVNERVLMLPNSTFFSFEIRHIEEKGKYLCLYTSYNEKDNIVYKNSIKIPYQKALQIIEENTVDIFKEETLDGIIINPNSDAIIIK